MSSVCLSRVCDGTYQNPSIGSRFTQKCRKEDHKRPYVSKALRLKKTDLIFGDIFNPIVINISIEELSSCSKKKGSFILENKSSCKEVQNVSGFVS